MKKFLLFFMGILFSGLAFAQGVTVKVVDKLADATGTDTYVYCKADGKIYAYNTLGNYEEYGLYSKVNTLAVAGADREIEYIETTTDMQTVPYINTGYIHKANTRIVVDCEIYDNDLRAYEAIFGARSGITRDAMIFFWRFGSDNTGCFAVNSNEQKGDGTPIPTGERVTVVAEGSELNVYYADDLYTPAATITNPQTQIDGNREMYIFDLNNNNNADNSRSFMKLYSFKIYEGDELKMDLVPLVTGDGRSGLKDKVSGLRLFSPNNVNFGVSPDGADALAGGGITAYEGKLVCLTTNNHEYHYTGGQWVDKGEMTKVELSNLDYKDMTTWDYPAEKADCFTGLYYDDIEDINIFNPYRGGAYWEPFVAEISTEPNQTYTYSFDYQSQAWGSWTSSYMNAVVCSGRPETLGTNNYFVNGDRPSDDSSWGVLAYHTLPRTNTIAVDDAGEPACFDEFGNFLWDEGQPQHIEFEFTATQDHHYLVFNFGLVEDDKDLIFAFKNLDVSRAVYPVTYSYAPQLAAAVALAEEFETTAVTTAALKSQLDAEIAKAKNLIANGTNEQQMQEYREFNELFDKVKANDFSGDVWTRTIALAKQDKVNTSKYEAYLNTGTESTYADQLRDLRIDRWAAHIEKSNHVFTSREAEPAMEGDYYLYNVGMNTFLVGGSDWGAHAALGWPGIKISLEPTDDGEGFYVNSHLYNCNWNESEYGPEFNEEGNLIEKHQGMFMGSNAYLDNGRYPWYFVPVEGKENVYNICKRGVDEETGEYSYFGYLGYNSHGRTDAGLWPCFNTVSCDGEDPSLTTHQWMLITQEQRDALVEGASKSTPADLSYLIKMPNFSQREYSNEDNGDLNTDTEGVVKGWRGVWNAEYGGNLSGRGGRLQDQNGDVAYDAYERDMNTLLWQQVDVPAAGYYGISVQALCRPGKIDEVAQLVADGEAPLYDSYLFVENYNVLLPLVTAEADKVPGIGVSTVVGQVPATHVDAIKFFENGLYKIEKIIEITNGSIFFGIDQQDVGGAGTQHWIMADNFRLKYYGEVDPATGIGNVETTEKQSSLNDGKFYTVQGIAVDRPNKPGIYVRNGRKIVVR